MTEEEFDAFDIDNEPSIFKKYGQDKILDISRRFYTKVHADKEQWFRKIFTVEKSIFLTSNKFLCIVKP
jgi:truncated hemoglobin YjbI